MDSIRRNIDLLLFEQFLLEKFSPEAFLEKARGVMELVRRGATQGERDAGKMGMQRLMLRAKEEITRMREEGTSAREIERFMSMLQQISSNTKEEPPRPQQQRQQQRPPPAVPKFRVGQWVVCTDDDSIGKVVAIHTRHLTFTYEMKMTDGAMDMFSEAILRAATQEDIDRAAARRQTPAKFKGGQFVVHLDDGAMGRIAKDGEGWDKSTHSRWYQVQFLDGKQDLVEERYLRAATVEEVEAKLKSKSQQPGSAGASGAKVGNDIQAFARYVNPAERSDKVYGIVKRNGKYHTFWGGYGKALATKHYEDRAEAFRQYESKERKGYRQTPPMGATHTWLDTALNARFAKLGESRRFSGPRIGGAIRRI